MHVFNLLCIFDILSVLFFFGPPCISVAGLYTGRFFTTFRLVASGGWLPRVFVFNPDQIHIVCFEYLWYVIGLGCVHGLSTSQWWDGGSLFHRFSRFLRLGSLRGATL